MKRYDGNWVFTFHNTFGEGEGVMRPLSILNDAIFCRNVLKERRVICVTEFVKNDLISRGFDRNALDVVPTGVSPAERGSTEEDYILFTGRLVSTKGIKYLIRAMDKVDCKLKIMGSGPEERRLKVLISKLGLQNKIELMGHVDEVTKESTMAACKIFVMPSLFESLGLATAEAMTYGKPIIASSIGGLPEIVGEGGILVPPKDPDAISTALNKLLHDDVLRAGYSNAALQQVDKYSWEHIIPKIESAYERAIRDTT
jgi:glycosyltransferase involved in cell wall biosynthesis